MQDWLVLTLCAWWGANIPWAENFEEQLCVLQTISENKQQEEEVIAWGDVVSMREVHFPVGHFGGFAWMLTPRSLKLSSTHLSI